eukprot:TRINITY_DN25857_c0_g1_i1.p1 TRINITY_DN25857_c0_g1~~TRINITY_DN25857_c0_g1_i1.p1  ORF type:complete len:883 (+),score=209.04 TRINITY_DN25857_c0_g1_i1:392-2650(+)
MHRNDKDAAAAERATQAERFPKEELFLLRRRVEALSAHLSSVLTPVSAVCRARPLTSYQEPPAGSGARTLGIEGQEVTVEDASGRSRKFKIDRVLDGTTSQEDLFLTAAPWVEHAALGGSSCVFAYGATGSGKTHSILGSGDGVCPGLAHHAVRRLVEGQGGGEVRLSMLEVYCEQIRDLLASPEGTGQPTLQCSRRDGQGRMMLDCVQVLASRASEAEELLMRGFANRATEGTLCNERSSRSHVVLTVQATGPKGGRLVLVDLAGSENVQRSGADEDAKLLAEAKAINRSLSALADVVEATAKQQSFVPYRNSRLTMLLEEALCCSKVLLLVHVSPFLRDSTDTAHSLQFASRVRAVDFGAQRLRQDQEDRARAAQLRSQLEARQLQTQLEQVKRELAESQKVQQELKQQVSQMAEQLREKQRELIREQELRSKAEESAREHRHAMARGNGGGNSCQNDTGPHTAEPRAAPASRPISPCARAASASRLHAPRATGVSARSAGTPVPDRPQSQPQTAPEPSRLNTPARQRPVNSSFQGGILVDSELLEANAKECADRQSTSAVGSRPVLSDRTNSAEAAQLSNKENDSYLVAKEQDKSAAVLATPTRPVPFTPDRTATFGRSPSLAEVQKDATPRESPGRFLEYHGVQVRSVLKRLPSDFRGRLLQRQELGAAASSGKRVTFAEEEQEACSPPRWYLDLLESEQAAKQVQQEAKASGHQGPRSLTPPMRRRPEVARETREPSREVGEPPRWR